jgi:uncharacterized protein HemX
VPTDGLHLILDIVTPLVLGLVAYMTLRIRSDTADAKADLLAHQNKVKEELVNSNAAIAQKLAVHEERDENKFARIDERFDDGIRRFDAIDGSLRELKVQVGTIRK